MRMVAIWSEVRRYLIGAFEDGIVRTCLGFTAVEFDTPRGCIGGYFPEMNALVPLSSVGEGSFTPTSKSILVRIEKA